MIEDQVKFFKALADASRVRIIKSLMESPMYVELLSERLELAASTVSFHLKKLEDVGLVTKEKDQYYIIYSLNSDLLGKSLGDWLKGENANVSEEDQREAAYRQKILDTFFKFNQLKSIPVQRKKRLVVLEHMVEAFSKERTYTEKEVNLIIADFHDDFATLRREFINEKLMTRENSIYKRVK
jgi:ArsR family transcriptional regulator